MSRSLWASTEGCEPVSAMTCGAGGQARLGEQTRLETLLDAVFSTTRLLWVLAASLAVLALGSSPALAGTGTSGHDQRPVTRTHSHTHKASARTVVSGRHRGRAAGGHPVAGVVLARGNGYATSGGSVVRSLQRRLARAGFAPGPVDGLFGARTENAVRRFQDSRGLQVDGIAGRVTRAALTASAPALYPGAGYRAGGSGLVRELQRRLVRAGDAPGPVDGLYGPRTARAVRHFQAAHRLPADGVANQQTFIDVRAQARPHPPADKSTTRRQAEAHRQTSRPRPRRTVRRRVRALRRTAGRPSSAEECSADKPVGFSVDRVAGPPRRARTGGPGFSPWSGRPGGGARRA